MGPGGSRNEGLLGPFSTSISSMLTTSNESAKALALFTSLLRAFSLPLHLIEAIHFTGSSIEVLVSLYLLAQ